MKSVETTKTPIQDKPAKRFQLSVGTPFTIYEVPPEQLEAVSRHEKIRTSLQVCWFVLFAALIFTGVSGVFGLMTNDYRMVMAVWSVAGPIVGIVLTYLFSQNRSDSG